MLSHASDQADFSYDTAQDGAGLPARVAIYGENADVRCQIAEDLGGAGFRTIDGGSIAALLEGPIALLGDVVLVDCAVSGSRGLDGMTLAGLARLDMGVARSGAKLIVSTSMAALDDVFAVLDQSNPQILVAPSRAERVVAVGRIMGEAGASRVREMSEDDRLALLRLSQQVEAIAHSLDRLSQPVAQPGHTGATSLSDYKRAAEAAPMVFGAGSPSQLPDPQMVRQVIANRQARARFFDAELFGDPAWDMLLDLTAAHGEGAQVSVTSLCIAASVPATTALRWLTQMVESGIFVRVPDPADKRRAFIALSDRSLAAMAGYFASLRAPMTLAA
ncbi:MAG: hypothetical protein RIT17_221 [Pseudomonadota bacterium]|jgi:hypothetical protein